MVFTLLLLCYFDWAIPLLRSQIYRKEKNVFAKQITRNLMLLSLAQALIRAKWIGPLITLHYSNLIWIVGQKL